mgnify:CR=1 FL=1
MKTTNRAYTYFALIVLIILLLGSCKCTGPHHAIEQLEEMKDPIIVFSEFPEPSAAGMSSEMTVRDGDGNLVMLMWGRNQLIEKYNVGDTIKLNR